MAHIAFFITPHGYGHAARAAAVMAAIREQIADVHFEIHTTVPEWFFRECLGEAFDYHHCHSDIGLIQSTPFTHDLNATLHELDARLPFSEAQIDALTLQLGRSAIDVVVSDIAPLGMAVAHRARIPSVLMENFTWDWIYAPYLRTHSGFRPHIDYLTNLLLTVDCHIQTDPICHPVGADLCVGPISRRPRSTRQMTRKRLAVNPDEPMVLISTGGIQDAYGFIGQLKSQNQNVFVVLGGAATMQRRSNVILLPHRSPFYHPDLVQAADLVVGKAGYSTIAEVYHAGVPFAYVIRKHFLESPVLAKFIEANIPSQRISESDFHTGVWISNLAQLLAIGPVKRARANAAREVAAFIAGHYLR